MNPHAVSPTLLPGATEAAPNRPGRFRLPGFDPRESPLFSTTQLTTRRTGSSLGLFPFQGIPPHALKPHFRGPSSRVLGVTAIALIAVTLHLRVSISVRLTLSRLTASRHWDKAALLRFLRHASPDRSSRLQPGL
jgi:hypothetical protein